MTIQYDGRTDLTDGGRRSADYAAADRAYQEKIGNPDWERPQHYTWHHQNVGPNGRGQMVLVETRVHKAAKYYGPYSLYRDIRLAQASGSKSKLRELLPRLRTFKNIRVITGAGGVIMLLISTPRAAYAGYREDGVGGAIREGSRDIAQADLVEDVLAFPANQAHGLLMNDGKSDEYFELRMPYKHGIKNDGRKDGDIIFGSR